MCIIWVRNWSILHIFRAALSKNLYSLSFADGLDAQVEELRELHNQTDIDINQMMKEFFDMSCDQCDDGFASLEEAQFHYHEKHGIDNGYVKCCGRRFLNKVLIRSHILRHTRPELFR